MRRRGWPPRLVLAVGVAVTALGIVTSPAHGLAAWNFVGKVTDPFGAPIAGAVVSDGVQQATTDSAGTYSLGENTPTTYTLTAQAPDHAAQTKRVTVTVPQDTTVDFTLSYLIGGSFSKPDLSTVSGPAQSSLTITDDAPAAGTCVSVSDPRTAQTTPATLVSQNSDGTSTWTWTLSVPQSTPEGHYPLGLAASTCPGGQPVTDTGQVYYTIDNTPPQVSNPFPTGYVSTTGPFIGATATDAMSGISDPLSSISIDGGPLSQPSYSFSTLVIESAASGLAQGTHHAVLTVSDWAGNTTSISTDFTIVTAPPAFSAQAPVGPISDTTPKIRAAVASTAPLKLSSLSMTLSVGPLSCSLPVQYAATNGAFAGVISYQVPNTPQGPCLGEFPLLPTAYSVQVSVTDLAGNRAISIWTFSEG